MSDVEFLTVETSMGRYSGSDREPACKYCVPATTVPIMSVGAMVKIDDLHNMWSGKKN